MADVDWSRGDLYHSCTVLMVDPTNFSDVRGELRGVTGGNLNLHYYGDTRMGAELTTVGDHGWDGSAALRIVHSVSDYTGPLLVETLFTGFVTDAPWQGEGDEMATTWTLKSGLYAMETAVCEMGYGIASGSKALTIVSQICGSLGRPYRIDSTANEHVYSKNCVLDPCTTYLSILFDVCDRSGNRMSVDEDGTITFSGYVSPSERGVDYDASEVGGMGMVIGPVSGSPVGFDNPARVVVRGDNGQSTVTGVASVPAGSPTSADVRGYRYDHCVDTTDVTPFTNEGAAAAASRYLKSSLSDDESISHDLMYRPLREGQIERLTMADGSRARWMVSAATLDLGKWTWALDLKGGWE